MNWKFTLFPKKQNSVDKVLGEGFPGRIVKKFGHCSSLVPMAYIFESASTDGAHV
jgi:hypothetical protein